MAQLIREWVMSCEQGIRDLRINPRLTSFPLQNPNEYIPGMQLVLMTDASFRSAGYALMIENNPDQKVQ